MDSRLRDFSLMLLGALLLKPERTRVLSQIQSGSLSPDLEPLVEALRKQNGEPIKSWLESRAVVIENQDAIGSLAKTLADEKAVRAVQAIAAKVKFVGKCESRDELRSRLKSYLDVLE